MGRVRLAVCAGWRRRGAGAPAPRRVCYNGGLFNVEQSAMIVFVSGVDTDAGKSIATGWLARRWMAAGKRVATVKLAQTGNVGASEDIARHRAMMGTGPLPEDAEGLTAPYIFPHPCSPELAARLAGQVIDPARLAACARAVDARYDVTLVEGAGGLMVPLTAELLTLDFAVGQGWPFAFVVHGALGSINHALLSFEALAARGAQVAQVIYNRWPGRKDARIDADTAGYLRRVAGGMFPGAAWLEMPVLEGV